MFCGASCVRCGRDIVVQIDVLLSEGEDVVELDIEPVDGHLGRVTPGADDEPDVEEVDLREEVLRFALGCW